MGAESALRTRPKDEASVKDEQVQKLNRRSEISLSTTTSYERR
jgi:hypothetical protein